MKLASYLKKFGHSQIDFANATGLRQGTVSRLAAGLFTPSCQTMNAIYTATRGAVTPNDFIISKPIKRKTNDAPYKRRRTAAR
jgi:predicted transcriptional regulator